MGSGSLEDGFAALGLSAWGPVITITASSALVLPLFFRYLRRTGNPASSIGFGIYRWHDVALGAAAAIAFRLTVEPGVEWATELLGLPAAISPQAPASLYEIFVAAVFVGVVGPFTEEVLFRGFLLEYLRPRVDSLVAIFVIGTVAFALPHVASVGSTGAIQTLLWGPVAIGLYFWRRSIYPPIAFHISNNLIALCLLST